MSEQVRVGVIGTSWWADMMHLASLKSHPSAVTAAICGRTQEPAEELAQKYDIPQVFTDYQDMLEKVDLQAVIVVTPDDLHYPMTMAALDVGLHVLCEKPLALGVNQAREMYEKAEAAGVTHMIMFIYRWVPVFAYLKQLVTAGYLGNAYHGHFHWITDWSSDASEAYSWYFDPNRSHGVLGSLGSHMIDLAHWYFGDIRSVSATLSTFGDRSSASTLPQDANDSTFILAEFASGAHGTIHCSTVGRLAAGIKHGGQVVLLYGSEGTLEVRADLWSPSAPTTEIVGYRRGADRAQVLEIPASFYGNSDVDAAFDVFSHDSVGTRLFIDSILNNFPVDPSFEQGYRVERVIDAAIQSHESNRKISL